MGSWLLRVTWPKLGSAGDAAGRVPDRGHSACAVVTLRKKKRNRKSSGPCRCSPPALPPDPCAGDTQRYVSSCTNSIQPSDTHHTDKQADLIETLVALVPPTLHYCTTAGLKAQISAIRGTDCFGRYRLTDRGNGEV